MFILLPTIFLTSASAHLLRRQPHGHERPLSSLLSFEDKRRLFEKVLETGSTASIQNEMAQATENFTNFTSLDLPQEVSSLLHGSLEPSEDVALDEKSIHKARAILNDMIVQAQKELDSKTLACKEFRHKNRKTFAQVSTDLSRLGTQIADLERLKAEAQKVIQSADGEIVYITETRDDAQLEYDNFRRQDEDELVWRKNDLRVAEFILRLTACKKGKAFLSMPTVQKCDLEKGKYKMRFVDRRLQLAAKTMQPKSQKKLSLVLMKSHEPNTAGATGAAALGSSKPASARKQAGKCSLGKPNCGRLHDNMSLMWGDMRDAVDELEAEMRKKGNAWDKKRENWNAQISMYTSDKQTHNSQLAEAIANLVADSEEQVKKEQEGRRLENEYAVGWAKCIHEMNEILFTKICGTKKVRGELHKKSNEVKPDDIEDCEIGDWVAQMCTVPCDDNLKGGVQTMLREIIQRNNENGVPCDKISLQEEIKCNQVPCPVDCKLDYWSGFSSCSKDCGGGIKTRSRGIVDVPKNGGASCDTQQEVVACNVGSCDRDCDLTPWNERPCTVACGGGEVVRRRHVKREARANGRCPKKFSSHRFERHDCNTQECYGDEECVAKQDVVVALDGSGSVTEEGFDVLKNFTSTIIRRFRGEREIEDGPEHAKAGPEAEGLPMEEASRVGVVSFGNGELAADGSISAAKIASSLSSDVEAVAGVADGLEWERGFTNMAQAFSAGSTLFLNGGRGQAQSVLIVISDGKPSFKFQTENAVNKLRHAGVKVIMIVVKEFPGKDLELMKQWASLPKSTNLIHVPGIKRLKMEMDRWVDKVVVHACPKTVSVIHEEQVKAQLEKEKELDDWMGFFEGEELEFDDDDHEMAEE